MASVMPQEWYDRMDTIKTYEEDASALGAHQCLAYRIQRGEGSGHRRRI